MRGENEYCILWPLEISEAVTDSVIERRTKFIQIQQTSQTHNCDHENERLPSDHNIHDNIQIRLKKPVT